MALLKIGNKNLKGVEALKKLGLKESDLKVSKDKDLKAKRK